MSAPQPSTARRRPAKRPLPIIIAHRGASGYAPEHTLLAYFIAIEQGAEFIEPDLVATRDGVLVARHENEIGATTDVAQRAEFANRRARKIIDGVAREGWFTEDFTLAEVKRLRARERIGELRPANARFDGQLEIATLDEILGLVRALERAREAAAHARGIAPPAPIGVYPETKHPTYFAEQGLALEGPLLEALRRHGYQGRDAPIFIQSFEMGNLRALRERTQLPLVQLIERDGAPYDLLARGDARRYAQLIEPAGLDEIAHYADAVGVEKTLVVPRTEDGALAAPSSLVNAAHAAGLAVHAWTFRAENAFLPVPLRSGSEPGALGDLSGEIAAYLAAGVDGLFADQPFAAVRARDAFIAAHGACAPR